jgi:nitrogen-specific signal transduction histidine kinase
VPGELEDRLFSRFVHQGEDPLLTGTVGLGLAVAQLLTRRSGGTISYHRHGGETVFAVTFPLAVDTLSSALEVQGTTTL